MRRLILILLAFGCQGHAAFAQTSLYPKREFRAAWIATVSNIDWPSRPGLDAQQQQEQFRARLDQLKSIGCNAVIVQIRPAADAFYPSELEPWSRFLTGRQGQPPVPYYDPLEFMVRETHERGMEFHAWFNPFRALTDSRKNPNPPEHVTRQHPDWILSYGGKSYIDPGRPEARDYVRRVMEDVARRYDIDAVHLDDYFYPYRIAGLTFPDHGSFAIHNPTGLARDDWRRQNVTTFIDSLNRGLKRIKPWMKLGISPFGVWRNQSKDPEGSPTRGGQTNYDDLFADVRLWSQRGWIDYLMPQLYWERGHRLVAFEVLLPWWRDNGFGRHVYYGLGLYRMLPPAKGTWTTTGEITAQIQHIRAEAPGAGWALYSASNLDKIAIPIGDAIHQQNVFPALPPAMPWLDSVPPPPPVASVSRTDYGLLLQMDPRAAEFIRAYAIYRFPKGEPQDLSRADRLIALTGKKEFTDADAARYPGAVYVVTALDRVWNESAGTEATEKR